MLSYLKKLFKKEPPPTALDRANKLVDDLDLLILKINEEELKKELPNEFMKKWFEQAEFCLSSIRDEILIIHRKNIEREFNEKQCEKLKELTEEGFGQVNQASGEETGSKGGGNT